MQTPVSSNNIDVLCSSNENHYFDRKSARIKVRDLAKTVIAFANAAGGKLVVGIEDDGAVTGFKCVGAGSMEEFEQAGHL
ncbi:helix-turn-helix domain-containing protein [Olsenella phocaeensis]|uniref:AlbA family DNA-binding domain-containing protein n=1 Tax=Olsenella phocaeensis TaxID=1852385 RepID=UPI003A94EEF6